MLHLLRISEEDEHRGLDASKHGGSAYNTDGRNVREVSLVLAEQPSNVSKVAPDPSKHTVPVVQFNAEQ